MLSASAPCFAGIDGSSRVEVSLPWLCGMTICGGLDGAGGGFAKPCCSCAAAGSTPASMIAIAINMRVNPEIRLRRVAGRILVVIAMQAPGVERRGLVSNDPICLSIEQAALFSGFRIRDALTV